MDVVGQVRVAVLVDSVLSVWVEFMWRGVVWLDAPAWISLERGAVMRSRGRESKEMVEQGREREQIQFGEGNEETKGRNRR